MADNYLITGYWGEPHVTAENDRGFNAAVFGAGRFVLPVGEMFKAEYIGNNTVRVYDGKLLDGGAMAGIPAGKYIDFLIPEAGQGMNRNDLIIFEYSQDDSTLIESGVFKVVSGIETSGTAADPKLHNEDILSDSAMLDQMALLRVRVSGAVISAPEILFETKYAGEKVIDFAHGGTEAVTLSGARNNLGIVTTVRNLLDNSDFSNPVAQAGLNGMHGTTSYAVDRWTANKLTVAQQEDSLKATPTETYAYIRQKVQVTPGKKYTCAAKFSSAGVGAIRIYNEDMTTQYVQATKISMIGLVTFTVPAGVSVISVVLYPNQTNVASGLAYWAALYEGEYTKDTLPTYQPKGYGAELAECQRYYIVASARHASGMYSSSGNKFHTFFPIPVSMRIVPTVTILLSENIISVTYTGGTATTNIDTVTSVAVTELFQNGVKITVNTGKNPGAYTQGAFYGNFNIEMSADL